MEERKVWVAYLLWFFFGLLGVHKFYVNKFGMGILYLLTAGLCLVGWIIDLFTIPSQVRHFNKSIKRLSQAID